MDSKFGAKPASSENLVFVPWRKDIGLANERTLADMFRVLPMPLHLKIRV